MEKYLSTKNAGTTRMSVCLFALRVCPQLLCVPGLSKVKQQNKSIHKNLYLTKPTEKYIKKHKCKAQNHKTSRRPTWKKENIDDWFNDDAQHQNMIHKKI